VRAQQAVMPVVGIDAHFSDVDLLGDVAATICRRLCCRASHNVRRFV
jgi:hypothetical protein